MVDVLVTKARRAAAAGRGQGSRARRWRRCQLAPARAVPRRHAPQDGLHGFLPSREMCTDNAAMIASAGWHRLRLDGPTRARRRRPPQPPPDSRRRTLGARTIRFSQTRTLEYRRGDGLRLGSYVTGGAGGARPDGGRDERAVPRPVPPLRTRPRLRQRDGDGDRCRARQRQDRADDDVHRRRAPAQPADVRQRSGDDGSRRAHACATKGLSTTSTSTSVARRPR